MELIVAAVGRPRTPGLSDAIAEYESRARRHFRLRVVEVPASGGADPGRAVREEGRALLEAVPSELELWALTRRGRGISSRRLARHLSELGTYGLPGAAFLVGGAYGLADTVLDRARYRLALSPMTLPHEMARLVLAEQLYRAGTILTGRPYHKGP